MAKKRSKPRRTSNRRSRRPNRSQRTSRRLKRRTSRRRTDRRYGAIAEVRQHMATSQYFIEYLVKKIGEDEYNFVNAVVQQFLELLSPEAQEYITSKGARPQRWITGSMGPDHVERDLTMPNSNTEPETGEIAPEPIMKEIKAKYVMVTSKAKNIVERFHPLATDTPRDVDPEKMKKWNETLTMVQEWEWCVPPDELIPEFTEAELAYALLRPQTTHASRSPPSPTSGPVLTRKRPTSWGSLVA